MRFSLEVYILYHVPTRLSNAIRSFFVRLINYFFLDLNNAAGSEAEVKRTISDRFSLLHSYVKFFVLQLQHSPLEPIPYSYVKFFDVAKAT